MPNLKLPSSIFDNNIPERIDTIVISTQHDDFDEESKMLSKIKSDTINILIERVKKRLPDHIAVF